MLRSEVWLGDTQERLFHQSHLLLFPPDLWHPNHAQSLSVLPPPPIHAFMHTIPSFCNAFLLLKLVSSN